MALVNERAKIKIIVSDITGKFLSILVDSEHNTGQYETSFRGDFQQVVFIFIEWK